MHRPASRAASPRPRRSRRAPADHRGKQLPLSAARWQPWSRRASGRASAVATRPRHRIPQRGRPTAATATPAAVHVQRGAGAPLSSLRPASRRRHRPDRRIPGDTFFHAHPTRRAQPNLVRRPCCRLLQATGNFLLEDVIKDIAHHIADGFSHGTGNSRPQADFQGVQRGAELIEASRQNLAAGGGQDFVDRHVVAPA